jgi:hypothetical protein
MTAWKDLPSSAVTGFPDARVGLMASIAIYYCPV